MLSIKTFTCKMCGKSFESTANRASFCPDCRKLRQKDRNYEYRRKKENNEVIAKIGGIQICAECGKEFVRKSASQKVCENCRDAYRYNQKKISNAEHKKHSYDECSVLMRKDGTKERITKYAKCLGFSISGLFITAVEEYMRNHPLK